MTLITISKLIERRVQNLLGTARDNIIKASLKVRKSFCGRANCKSYRHEQHQRVECQEEGCDLSSVRCGDGFRLCENHSFECKVCGERFSEANASYITGWYKTTKCCYGCTKCLKCKTKKGICGCY